MARGLLILSVITFILGTLGVGFALYLIIAEAKLKLNDFKHNTEHFQHVLHIKLDTKIINIVTGILLILATLAMGFSILLFVGIKKHIAGFVLAYFSYGSMLVIILYLTGLLEFIQGYWYLGAITFFVSSNYVCCLHNVYNKYNLIQKDTGFEIDGHTLLINEEQISLPTEQL